MKTLKRSSVFFAVILVLSTFLTGCKKEDTPSATDKIEGLFYYYTDMANNEIRVVDLNAVSPFRRSYTLTDEVTLGLIADERPHLVLKFYRPSAVSPMANDKGQMIKSKVADSEWLFVANNPFQGLTGIAEEAYFNASEFAEGATGFILHKIGEEGGETLYAIESLKYPGTYFSHDGHPIQGANLLYLKPFDSPEKAPGFRLYNTYGDGFVEGDPNVPKDFEIGGE